MLANIGCGEWHADGWTNIDLHSDGPKPDLIGSILALPLPDASCQRVYLGHILEHLTLHDLPRALAEVDRVLAPDGRLMVVGPCIHLTRRHEPVLVGSVTHGGGRWPGDEHQWTSSGGITLAYVTGARFAAALIPVADVPDGWPVVDRSARWQFAITATRA